MDYVDSGPDAIWNEYVTVAVQEFPVARRYSTGDV